MKLFDTHCHFENSDTEEIRRILVRAREAGVEALTAVGGSKVLNEGAVTAWGVAKGDPALPRVFTALGYDREQLAAERPDVSGMLQDREALVAIGEIGLDYHYSPETRDAQRKVFAEGLESARILGLPVVIHTREADDDTLGLLKEIPSRGIIHCYTGTPEFAKAYLELGFYVSISGIVTFRAADNVRESALAIPDDRLLLETDSPFLAPVPLRGKPNEPAFIAHTCEFLARLKHTDAAALAAQTFENAFRAFNL